MLSVNYRRVVERTSTAVTLFSPWVRTGTSTAAVKRRVRLLVCCYVFTYYVSL